MTYQSSLYLLIFFNIITVVTYISSIIGCSIEQIQQTLLEFHHSFQVQDSRAHLDPHRHCGKKNQKIKTILIQHITYLYLIFTIKINFPFN